MSICERMLSGEIICQKDPEYKRLLRDYRCPFELVNRINNSWETMKKFYHYLRS